MNITINSRTRSGVRSTDNSICFQKYVKELLEEYSPNIRDTINAASAARVRRITTYPLQVKPKLPADAVIAKPASSAMAKTADKAVVVGPQQEACKC